MPTGDWLGTRPPANSGTAGSRRSGEKAFRSRVGTRKGKNSIRACYFFGLRRASSPTRVRCRTANSLILPCASPPLDGTPMKTRPPKTHANSGCGTSWCEPSERNSRNGRKGFRFSNSLIRTDGIMPILQNHRTLPWRPRQRKSNKRAVQLSGSCRRTRHGTRPPASTGTAGSRHSGEKEIGLSPGGQDAPKRSKLIVSR